MHFLEDPLFLHHSPHFTISKIIKGYALKYHLPTEVPRLERERVHSLFPFRAMPSQRDHRKAVACHKRPMGIFDCRHGPFLNFR